MLKGISKNDLIRAEDFIILLSDKQETSLYDMFEMFKARATLFGTKSITKKLAKIWEEDFISKETVKKIHDSKVFYLDSEADKERLSGFLVACQIEVDKNEVLKIMKEKFSDWEVLDVLTLKKFTEKLYDFFEGKYSQVVSVFKEKFPFSEKIRMTAFLDTCNDLALFSDNIEKTCLRCILFFISGSVTKIDYFQTLDRFKNKDIGEGLFKILEQKDHKISGSSRPKKSRREIRVETPRST